MATTYFDSCYAYIENASSKKEKLARIDTLQSALLDAATKAALNEDITEYSLDDGQTKIKKVYRGVTQITRAYNDLERIRNMFLNDINGRVMQLVDRQSNKL